MEIGQDNSSEALKKNAENKSRRKKKKDVTPNLKEEEGKARNTMEEDNHVTCRDPEGIASKQKCGRQKKNKKSKAMLRKARADEALDPKTGNKEVSQPIGHTQERQVSSDVSLESKPNRLGSEAHSSKKIFVNAVISLLHQGNVVQDKKRRDGRERSPRRLDKARDVQATERPLKNESCDVEGKKAHREIQFPCRLKTEESLFSRTFEETIGQGRDLTKSCPQGDLTVPLDGEDQSLPNTENRDNEVESNTVENATSERHSSKRELEKISITENTPQASTKDRCSRRRRSFDQKLDNKDGDSGKCGRHGDAAVSQTRQISHVSEQSDAGENDNRENGKQHSASGNGDDHCQKGNKTKESVKRSELKRPEVVRNHRGCNDNKPAKCSDFNRNSKNGSSKSERDLALGNQRNQLKSFDGASRKDTREIDRSGNTRSESERKKGSSVRRKSHDVTLEKDRGEKDLASQRKAGSPNYIAKNIVKGNVDLEHHKQCREKKGKQSSANDGSSRNGVREDHLGHPRENRRRRIASDSRLNNDPSEGEFPKNRRPCWANRRTHSESDIREESAEGKLKPSLVHISKVKPKSANNSQADQQVAPTIIDGQPQQQFWIDPEVRERIANPKDPVRMPDKPFLHRSYQNGVRYDDNINPNKSFVGGMFGREWRLEREREDLKRDLEEDAEEERRRKTLIHPKDNICPTFMIWGVCHRGDNCHLRHPPGRYLKRPPRNATSPEHAPEEPKKDPNSFAAILEKRSNPEPKEFVNDDLPKNERTIMETNCKSYCNALVQKDSTSCKAVTKKSFEEEFPCLGVSVKVHSKPKQVAQGPWAIKEDARKVENENDRVIAESLQADEYAISEQFYGDYYGETNEDEIYPDFQEQEFNLLERDINEDNLWHQETKARELEDVPYSSEVFVDQSIEDDGAPSPPPVISGICDICMDRPKDATLVCGHRFCYQCALQMRLDERVCAICRRCIVSVIKTYN
ncbi:semenogelin-1-like isoform X9 [Acropora muricata]